ncbi:MAG TPA: 50S ribosomal protein L10, partial [Promineifilum sp.]|nr:50S ribosomal protein L10 [Promineifilum sp.]
MAIKKERKDELVGQYSELLKNSSAIFLAQYSGMTVKEMEALRIKISDADGRVNVTKNTLLRVAMEANDIEPPLDLLLGELGFRGRDHRRAGELSAGRG